MSLQKLVSFSAKYSTDVGELKDFRKIENFRHVWRGILVNAEIFRNAFTTKCYDTSV